MYALATSSSAMDTLVGGIDTVTSVVEKCFDVMTSNPLIVFFIAVSLVGAGIGVFRHLKNAAN